MELANKSSFKAHLEKESKLKEKIDREGEQMEINCSSHPHGILIMPSSPYLSSLSSFLPFFRGFFLQLDNSRILDWLMDGAHRLSVSTRPALHLRNEKETFVISMKTFNGAVSFSFLKS